MSFEESCFYYPSGALYARLSKSQGIKEGPQYYFYEDGRAKTVESYQAGRLEGDIFLYWPNGSLKRKCHFERGIRTGKDQIWDEKGNLVDESIYGF